MLLHCLAGEVEELGVKLCLERREELGKVVLFLFLILVLIGNKSNFTKSRLCCSSQ